MRHPNDFPLVRGEEALTRYQFNTKISEHFFCQHCGIHTFGHPRSSPENFIINVPCLDDFDLASADYELGLFDGRDWEAFMAARDHAFKTRHHGMWVCYVKVLGHQRQPQSLMAFV
ncbi:MAG: hypothetical protein Ct9H300mP13_0460 [Gammaproteobacteria bacterium]|nr:MAG: hypothetical protein Ct9H300mP13_0460 [Gammaproteobacteria bacterium]